MSTEEGDMPEDVLDLLVVLDRSGSMQTAKTDHEGGLKSFIEDQRSLDGDVRLTLIQFDSEDPCEVVFDRVPLDTVKDVRLLPRGGTPLLDAVGRACSYLRSRLTSDARVVALVITDGHENHSREWTKERVRSLVKELESAGWTFLFLGADIDSFAEAGSMGMSTAGVMNFSNHSRDSVRFAYGATSRNMLGARASAARSASLGRRESASSFRASLGYTSAQRAAAVRQPPTNKRSQPDGAISCSSDFESDEEAEG